MKAYYPHFSPTIKIVPKKQKELTLQYINSFYTKYKGKEFKISFENERKIYRLIAKHFDCKLKIKKIDGKSGSCYNPKTKTIELVLSKKHLHNNIHSFFHELSHHIQNLCGRFKNYYRAKLLSYYLKLEQECEALNVCFLMNHFMKKEAKKELIKNLKKFSYYNSRDINYCYETYKPWDVKHDVVDIFHLRKHINDYE